MAREIEQKETVAAQIKEITDQLSSVEEEKHSKESIIKEKSK